METKDIIKKVRRIEIKSRRKTNNLFLGEYHSSFKGRGMIFSEVRPYQFGDDVRKIDWNKTARFNEPYVKVFEEERELTMMLVVDISESENFGTKKQLKRETIAEICATLAFSAIAYNDKVGLLLYSGEIELLIPPKKGRKHVLRIIRELVEFKPKNRGTNLNVSLSFLLNTLKRKSNIFILSDFIDDSDYGLNMRILARKHDVAGIRIYDEKQNEFPKIGWVQMRDNETQETKLINTNSRRNQNHYRKYYKELREKFINDFKKNGAGVLQIRADEDYVVPLLNYFKQHIG